MSVPSPNTAHETEAAGRLTSMFASRTVITGLVKAYAARVQALENTIWDVIGARSLSGSGIALDFLGALVGEPRRARADSLYRKALAVRIMINRSTGRIKEVLRIIDAVSRYTSGALTWAYWESPPAGFSVAVVTDDADTAEALREALREAHPSGVEVSVYSGPLPSTALVDGYLVPSSVLPSTVGLGPGTVTDNSPSAAAMHIERV